MVRCRYGFFDRVTFSVYRSPPRFEAADKTTFVGNQSADGYSNSEQLTTISAPLRLSPLDPRITFVHEGLAYAYFFLGNYEEGLKRAADALRHHPSYPGALRITMACNALSGNIEAAQKLWRQVALLSPSDRVSETRKRV